MNDLEYEDFIHRLQHEQQHLSANSPFPPQQIFDLACDNPIVHNLIERWRCGNLTWEQALSGMVVYLCATNKSTFQKLTEVIARNPEPTIISSQTLEYLKKSSD